MILFVYHFHFLVERYDEKDKLSSKDWQQILQLTNLKLREQYMDANVHSVVTRSIYFNSVLIQFYTKDGFNPRKYSPFKIETTELLLRVEVLTHYYHHIISGPSYI